MHDLAKQVFDLGMAINRAVAAAVQADQRGTPEAIADCRVRRETAIRRAQTALTTQDETIEDRLGSYFPDLPAEYDTDSDSGDENDGWGPV